MNPDDVYGEWPPIRCIIVNLDEINTPKSSALKTICGKPWEPGCVPSVEEWPLPWERKKS
jgi:hypothetical protein